MARRHRQQPSFWQSYADLAMGMMAVFALVLIMLLWLQSQEQAATEAELEDIQREREALEEERRQFADELLALIDATYGIVQTQDRAEEWIRALFEEDDCLLVLTEDGALELSGTSGTSTAALYGSGETRVSAEGAAALASCRTNFLRLAYCLSPDSDVDDGATEEAQLARAALCHGDARGPEETLVVTQLRRGIEALVLEGNTDMQPVGSLRVPGIESTDAAQVELSELSENYLVNAYLGSERARQAMGHLVGLLDPHRTDDRDALPVLLSRLRVESPSFGRYQVGPREWRTPGCDEDPSCEGARNLALRIRWQKAELRRPFETIRASVCELLRNEDSAFARGLLSSGRDLDVQLAKFGCEVEATQ